MTRAEAITYAISEIPKILPLEEQDVKDLCNQVLDSNTNPDAIANAFMNILGHEDMSFAFIFKFNELLEKKERVQNSPRIESKLTVNNSNNTNKSDTNSIIKRESSYSKINELHIVKKVNNEHLVRSKPTKSLRVPQSQKKTTEKGGKTSNLSSKQKKLQSLEEINDVVKFLDITNSRKNSGDYACSCQGKIHPIFELAPNCLSCGKIICIKEGLNLNSCSFCDHELIPMGERLELVDALNKERDDLVSGKEEQKRKEALQGKKKQIKTYKISSGMGKNLFNEQDKLFDFIERQHERERKREEVLKKLDDAPKEEPSQPQKKDDTDEELQKAQERLENLLHFQDTSAERTKIIDNASDFDMSSETGLWGNARERAMLLKKQQRNLRKWEKIERERNGKSDKYVVSMNIGVNGKVTMTEVKKNHENIYANSDEELGDISDDEDRNDLNELKSHKDQVEKEKEIDSLLLQSNVWDYEKDKEKFKRSLYIDSGESTTEDSYSHKPVINRIHRVQINKNSENSVEDNILAVL